jgi:polysaccharide export outer membrane protein
MSEPAVKARGTPAAPIQILPVTPQLLVQLSEDRVRSSGARARDPLAAEADKYEYRVAPFDVLSVTVWEHPELTIPAGEFRAPELAGNVVQADGTIFYPHVGVVQVAGRTIPEVRATLTERIRKYVENPQLDVRVAAFRGKRVQVTGQVVQPSVLPITDVPLRVQDAVSVARGLGPNAFPRGVTLTRGGTVYRLNLQALYDEGDVTQNWLLRDGDVYCLREDKVFVLASAPAVVEAHAARPDDARRRDRRLRGFDRSSTGAMYVFRGRYEAPRVYPRRDERGRVLSRAVRAGAAASSTSRRTSSRAGTV